jgi:hypothetical protein
MRRVLWVPLLVFGLVACDSPPPNGGTDGGPATCERPPEPFERGDPNGHPDPLGAGPGEARAGRIGASNLPASRNGLELWQPRDFVLANDRIAVIIEDVGDSDLYDRYGGRPVGMGRVEGGAIVETANFGEILLGAGGYLVATESVTVLDDGSDGSSAIVRAIGPLRAIQEFGDAFTSILGGSFDGFPAAIDYELEPGSDRVTVTMTVDSISPETSRNFHLNQAFIQHYRMPMWNPSGGFGEIAGPVRWIAFDDPVGASYAWEVPEGRMLTSLLSTSGVTVLRAGTVSLEGCTRTRVPLGTLMVGSRLNGAQAIAWRNEGVSLRTITGTVREADGSVATGVRVHATRGEAHLTRVLVGDDGTFSIAVPEGDVELWAYRRGFPVVGPVRVPVGTSTAELTMPPFGTLEVRAIDAASGEPLPARIQLFGSVPRPPASWGEESVGDGRLEVTFAGASGMVALRAPPGMHRVVVSRGYEYEIFEAMVRIEAGSRAVLDAPLVHSVPTPGVLCADYHIHTSRSPDAPDDARFKVLALVADGLELPVRSEHEFVADFGPVVRELGLERWALGLSGEELTTFAYGHFGVFPLPPDPMAPNGGAPRWPGRLAPELFADLRARPGSPTIIINHPRSFGSLGGYFNAVGYDPTTGTVGRPDHWDDQFSIVEVFNNSNFEDNRDTTVADWFSFLIHGRRVFAVGSSDSHRLLSSPIGYPRTCLRLGTDDPREVTPAQVRDATARGHSYVSGGIHIDLSAAGGEGPGDDVVAGGPRVRLRVVVRAPTWVDVDRLDVIVDGRTTETIPIRPEDADPAEPAVRLRAMLEADVAPGGSFVVVHASGDSPLEPVHPGRLPFAVTNPIFVRR